MDIHPTAIVSDEVQLGENVIIGPYCVVRGNTKIGSGTQLESHVTIGSDNGVVEIGDRNYFSPCSVIGGPPQDITYNGEPTRLVVGNDNTFREFCSLNIATCKEERITTIGNNNFLMAYTHVGHDCRVGDHIVIANNTHIAGHVTIEDYVKIGGVCCFNQHVRIGKFSFLAGDSTVNKDILPYSKAQGKYAVARATNKIGLERAGFSEEAIDKIHKSIRLLLMGEVTQKEALVEISEMAQGLPELQYLVDFIRDSKRGIAK